jgi:diguanylate cyclase (GGDEF)-like protein
MAGLDRRHLLRDEQTPAAAMLLRSLAGILLGLLTAAAHAAPVPAMAMERGFPLIQAYDPALPEAETQSFGIVRDPRGVLYVANLGGVLVYDGAWWQIIPVGREKMVFALASDARGQIAAGGDDELGLLTPDAAGTLRFVSLRDRLPAAQRDFGQVLSIQAIPGSRGGFAFMTARWLLLWDGARFTTAATFTGERPYAESFLVGSTIYVWSRDGGLGRLAGMRLAPVPGGEVFRGRRTDQLLAAGAAEVDGLLVSVRGEGLFRFRDGKAAPFAPEASRWTAAKRVVNGCRLADGRWALGSVLGGLLLLRPDGGIDQVIDTAAGLNDDYVTGLVVDREGSLWAALNNGLARLEVASPLSVLDRRSGLQGSIYSLARHRGALWVGTAAGLFTTAGAGGAPANGPTTRLRAVSGLPPAGWSLLPVDDDLLAGMAFGIFSIGPGSIGPGAIATPRRVPGSDEKTTFALARSRAEPSRVWIGTEEGLAAIRRTPGDAGEWRFEAKVAGITQEVRGIVEGKDGVLWCSTNGGPLRVELPPGWPAAGTPRISPVRGSDAEGQMIRTGDRRDRILAASGEQILVLDEARGELLPDPRLARFAGQPFDRLALDAGGNLWRNTRPPTLLLRQGEGWAPEPRSLPEVTARSIEQIVAEPDGVVWLATENGLLRYQGSSPGLNNPAAALPPPRIARVTSGGGKLLFGGEPGGGGVHGGGGAPVLPYDGRRLRIEFAPLSFRAGLRYRTWLAPLDAGWSAPTAEPFAELARVPPGDYTFRVRTIGPGGEAGPEASWPFHVRPPWYRTGWALALWAGLAIAAVLAYVRLRSRALHQRAERLEARVAEQTVELRRTVQELRRAHADLAAANGRLEELSLRDELTGIANRRRLQLALDEEWQRSWGSIAFILVDLDEFKRLNDTRGHLAGDLGLQAVAAFLEAAARRHGTLAARYGGEELAILLPGATLAAAADVAEELRRGIEGLAIPNPAAALGHLTASFGVAALAPAAGERPAELIAAADRALYRAKSEGRNRVCTSADPALPALPTTGAS